MQLEDEINNILIHAEDKGRLRATISKAAETVHLILLCYLGILRAIKF